MGALKTIEAFFFTTEEKEFFAWSLRSKTPFTLCCIYSYSFVEKKYAEQSRESNEIIY
jgi:hypothetical protein